MNNANYPESNFGPKRGPTIVRGPHDFGIPKRRIRRERWRDSIRAIRRSHGRAVAKTNSWRGHAYTPMKGQGR